MYGAAPDPGESYLAHESRVKRPASPSESAKAYPKRVLASRNTVPRPSQPATQMAPIRYHARYSGSLQPMALPRNSVPADRAYHSIPTAQINWYGRRRSSHWSRRKAQKMNDRTDDKSGRSTLKFIEWPPGLGVGAPCRRGWQRGGGAAGPATRRPARRAPRAGWHRVGAGAQVSRSRRAGACGRAGRSPRPREG